MVPCKIEDMTEKAAKELLKKIVDKLDGDDFFGSEGWKHYMGLEEQLSIPTDHKEFFKTIVEKHIEECQEHIVKYSKSLRLLDNEKTEPEYCVIIMSNWKDEGEKDVELTQKGSVRDVLRAAEKQFMEINNRDEIDGQYYVGMKVGGTVFPLPKKMWSKYKKRK